MEDMTAQPTWRKPSHSGGTADTCVELTRLPADIGIRDPRTLKAPSWFLSRRLRFAGSRPQAVTPHSMSLGSGKG
ncbi:DUF397 domain-containing protein [Actinomadura terrae]|uniref:DUF397 domain-containing protein n=1 Tax=Actinomadura terrae TaxID=604353 RepID=UPI003555EF68